MKDLLEQYPPVLSTNDVSVILGVTSKTVRKLVNTGELNSIKVGRLIRIPKDRLINFLERR